MNYSENDLLRLAKRHHNTKRTYLLVDPLQGKHMPVSPTKSLRMLTALGEKLHEADSNVNLVIGFAETATAVGAVVAACQASNCVYIHTTREPLDENVSKIEFLEEHSHAPEQTIRADNLKAWIDNADSIAFVDDEISTGKTLMNIIEALSIQYPALAGKRIYVTSIINRLSDDRIAQMREKNIETVALMHLPLTDYTKAVEKYIIDAPRKAFDSGIYERKSIEFASGRADIGVIIQDYYRRCQACAEKIFSLLREDIAEKSIAVIGTEEFMFPGMLLGQYIEESGIAQSVVFHATTRSPIGICGDGEYPIRNGIELGSFYQSNRTTYLYNLDKYDTVVIYTDSHDNDAVEAAAARLSAAFRAVGCESIILIQEDKIVQYI